jgi:hypothetical protein
MEILALYTIINGRKNYVSSSVSRRSFDNKNIVSYTTVAEEAKDFGSAGKAIKFIDSIVNPHDRVFKAEAVKVSAQKRQALEDADLK